MALNMLGPFLRRALRGEGQVARALIDEATARLAASGLTRGELANPHARVPHQLAIDLMELYRDRLADPAFALHAGAGVEPGDFGMLEYVARCAPTLGEGLRAASRYLPLLHDGAECRLDIEGQHAIWRHRLLPGVAASPGAHEYVVAAFLFASRHYHDTHAPPLEVHFIHEAPAHADEYRAVFCTPVRFGTVWNGIVLPASALGRSPRTADAGLYAALCRYADYLLTLLPKRHAFGRRVRDVLQQGLPGAQCSLAAVAGQLHMSARSVRRKLRRDGTTLKTLLDEVRREKAIALLVDPDLDLAEIAFRLGFARPPALHRAFKRWYGMGPTDYRKRHTGTPAYRLLAQR